MIKTQSESDNNEEYREQRAKGEMGLLFLEHEGNDIEENFEGIEELMSKTQ